MVWRVVGMAIKNINLRYAKPLAGGDII